MTRASKLERVRAAFGSSEGLAWLCFLSTPGIFVWFDPWDCQVSIWLQRKIWPDFAAFMGQSIFEGKSFGAGDLVIIIYILFLLAWLLSLLPRLSARLFPLRKSIRYILLNALLTGLVVHLIKGVVGRFRPSESGPLYKSSWVGLRSGFLHGWGHGSLPSGHTAQVMSLLAISFVLWQEGLPRLANLWAFLILLFALAMALSRIMLGAHWPSDTYFAIVLAWLVAERSRRYFLKVKDGN